jgi:hypothetical protein
MLRELDRFLSILLDEVAMAAGWHNPALRPILRVRDTARKLDIMSEKLGVHIEGAHQLRALNRCGNMFSYCDGIARRGDSRSAMRLTLGWPSDPSSQHDHVLRGDRLTISMSQFASICLFYKSLGDLVIENWQHSMAVRANTDDHI